MQMIGNVSAFFDMVRNIDHIKREDRVLIGFNLGDTRFFLRFFDRDFEQIRIAVVMTTDPRPGIIDFVVHEEDFLHGFVDNESGGGHMGRQIVSAKSIIILVDKR